jgi:hypothetical protein
VPKPQDLAGLPDGLSPLRLRPACDPKTLGFEATASLKPRVGFIGQDRAIDAIKLSAEIAHKGFNLYVLGREGIFATLRNVRLIASRRVTRAITSWGHTVNNMAQLCQNTCGDLEGPDPRGRIVDHSRHQQFIWSMRIDDGA